jgi:hypothetical protein
MSCKGRIVWRVIPFSGMVQTHDASLTLGAGTGWTPKRWLVRSTWVDAPLLSRLGSLPIFP